MDIEQRPRYYNQAFIIHLYSKMHTCLRSHVIGVKGSGKSDDEMKCH